MNRFRAARICTLFLALALAACQPEEPDGKEEPQPQVFVDLFVRYIAPQARYKIIASFTEGDSLSVAKSVPAGGEVKFQNIVMQERRLPKDVVRYAAQVGIPYLTEHTFRLPASAGAQPLEVTLSMSPVDTFEIIGGKASLKDGMQVYLPDGALLQDERLVFLFSDEENQAQTITLPGPMQRDTYLLAGPRLRKLSPGPHKLYLVKKLQVERELSETQNLRANVEFYTSTQEFEVVAD